MSAGESLFATLPQQNDASLPRMCHRGSSRFNPYLVTTIVSAIAILASLFPSLADGLQLDFARVADGQWWRLLSGHLTHFGSQHLFWDLLMFVVLGAACERQHPRLFPVSLIVMALGISVAVTFACKDVSGYRGLSGIDTGLFVWFIGDQIRQSLSDCDRMFAGFWTTAATLLVGKLLFEFVTGDVLFVDADGFKPLIESHLVGAAFGVLFAGVGILAGEAGAANMST
ncbi:rhombosortase [Novipirellula artificiosorum]|uniref:Intramembrane serine protease GlpG n=1 Tax=Novipirellula artificiosorum TaxID=2528016 RepID=A0A5C6DMZ2_9BACT|nr:rhombosortase [Novipirellula artificiosorum]TWU38200.1 intramembrane serine protease GlpG [Novipirellula artificiosorum]